MRGIDHQSVGLAGLASERLENPVEHAELAPSKEAIVERLVRTIRLRSVLPLKSMFQNVNNTTDDQSIIDTRNAVCERKIRSDPAKL